MLQRGAKWKPSGNMLRAKARFSTQSDLVPNAEFVVVGWGEVGNLGGKTNCTGIPGGRVVMCSEKYRNENICIFIDSGFVNDEEEVDVILRVFNYLIQLFFFPVEKKKSSSDMNNYSKRGIFLFFLS